MKRYSLVFSLCVMSYSCMAGVARAQVTLTLVNPPSSIISNNIYVGPYSINVTGGGTVQLVCDDYVTETSLSEVWKANVLPWSQVSQAEFYNTAGLQGYEAVASLTEMMFANLNNPTLVTEIHYAIWAIFTPSASTSAGFDAEALQLYNTALAQYNTPLLQSSHFSDFNFITIYDPAPGYTAQEFLGTPEPASMMLFGTGLLAIGAAIRRRRAR
jgi:hypothetical protein